jgi:uncharacterized membrane protein
LGTLLGTVGGFFAWSVQKTEEKRDKATVVLTGRLLQMTVASKRPVHRRRGVDDLPDWVATVARSSCTILDACALVRQIQTRSIHMALKVFQALSIVLLSLVMGVFWGTWFTLTRSLDTFSAAEFIDIGKTIIANVKTPMQILMPLTLIVVATTAWLTPEKRSPAFYLQLAALLLAVAALVITVGVEVPIDNQIKTWTVTTVPADWEAQRAHWQTFHTLRTFVSIGALACMTIGTLSSTRRNVRTGQ